MQNLDNSLSMYYALRQQKAAEISTRIGQIQQQLPIQTMVFFLKLSAIERVRVDEGMQQSNMQCLPHI